MGRAAAATVRQRPAAWGMAKAQGEEPPRSTQVCRERKCQMDVVEGVVGEVEGEVEDEAGADEGVAWRLYRRRRGG